MLKKKLKNIKLHQSNLYVENAGHKGRGVFTSKKIMKGEIIEFCPVIEINKKDHYMLIGNKLENYVFEWNNSKKTAAVVLGYGSLYNHSQKANAEYLKNIKENIMVFKATKNIKVNDEILINYGESHEYLNNDPNF